MSNKVGFPVNLLDGINITQYLIKTIIPPTYTKNKTSPMNFLASLITIDTRIRNCPNNVAIIYGLLTISAPHEVKSLMIDSFVIFCAERNNKVMRLIFFSLQEIIPDFDCRYHSCGGTYSSYYN